MRKRPLLLVLPFVLLAADVPKESEVPELNQKVLAFARDHLGKKVGDGECATLAVQALRAAKARGWSTGRGGEYLWGKLIRTVEPGKNDGGEVLPGDILQFHEVRLVSKVRRVTTEATYPLHTAIVETVKDEGKTVEILHQNAGELRASDEERRKVKRTMLRFADLKHGTIKIFRPSPPN